MIKISKIQNISFKRKLIRFLKFYLIPGARDPQFTAIEYEIGKVKSKRRIFRRIFTPLTILGFVILFLIIFMAIFIFGGRIVKKKLII